MLASNKFPIFAHQDGWSQLDVELWTSINFDGSRDMFYHVGEIVDWEWRRSGTCQGASRGKMNV